jgi:hypothetical protein
VIFYESIYEACKGLSPEDRAQTYDAVISYGCAGIIPEGLSPVPTAIFTMAKPLMDAAKNKRENGKKGGRPRKDAGGFLNFEPSGTDYGAVADQILEKQNKK